MFAPKYLIISMPFCLTQHNPTNKEQTRLQKYHFTVLRRYIKNIVYTSYVKKYSHTYIIALGANRGDYMGGDDGLVVFCRVIYWGCIFGRLSAGSASMPEDYMVHICDGGLSDSLVIWQTS